VDRILGDIHKGVTTHPKIVNFCENYSFMSSLEPFMIEDALKDLDWLVAMEEELKISRGLRSGT
jgi:isochorismate hydrolase